MVFEPLKQWKWPSIITLVDYPNQNPPTDSADEASLQRHLPSTDLSLEGVGQLIYLQKWPLAKIATRGFYVNLQLSIATFPIVSSLFRGFPPEPLIHSHDRKSHRKRFKQFIHLPIAVRE